MAKQSQNRALVAHQPNDVRKWLAKLQPQFQMAISKRMPLTPDRLIRVTMTAIQKNPQLLECTRDSLLGSIFTCAQLGLTPDGILGQAYLIPYWNGRKQCREAQMQIGYKGFIELARRTGDVESIMAQVVFDNDEFEFEFGLDEKLRHKPNLGERGRPVCAYAVAKFKSGGYAFDVMSVAEIDEIKENAQAKNDGPWKTHWEQMARKTAIRRLAKYLPMSVEVQRAVALDETAAEELPQDLGDAFAIEVEGRTEPTIEEKTRANADEAKAKLAEKTAKPNPEGQAAPAEEDDTRVAAPEPDEPPAEEPEAGESDAPADLF